MTKSHAGLVAAITLWTGILSGGSAEAADVCELSGGVLKGGLCFLPCENPGEVRVQQPNGELACVPPGQPAAAAPPAPAGQAAALVKPVQPVAPVAKANDECLAKGGVRLGVACFLPCPNPNETRVQFANGALLCVAIAGQPGVVKAKKVPAGKNKP